MNVIVVNAERKKEMVNKDQFQQGDVVIRKIDNVPSDSKKSIPSATGFVLAEGEHTGHRHQIAFADEVEMFERNGTLYLSVGEGGATITHEEHAPVELPAGNYEVGNVREYDPFEEEMRKVQD